MLELVSDFIYFATDILYYAFKLSYQSGQFIVTLLNTIATYTAKFIVQSIAVFKIIIEDFHYFLHDVFLVCCGLTDFLSELFTVIISALYKILNVYYAITWIIYGFYNGLFRIFEGITYVIGSFKILVILFGSGVWYAVTLIPLLFIYFCTLCIYYAGSVMQELYSISKSAIKNLSTSGTDVLFFFTEFPIEAVAGLAVGICIVYMFVVYYMILYNFVYKWFVCLKNNIRRKVSLYNQVRAARYQNQQRILHRKPIRSSRGRTNFNDSAENVHDTPQNLINELYCVICQERHKCILLLPCRHVCLCNECNLMIRSYNNTCPLCRKNIEHSMKIFV